MADNKKLRDAMNKETTIRGTLVTATRDKIKSNGIGAETRIPNKLREQEIASKSENEIG